MNKEYIKLLDQEKAIWFAMITLEDLIQNSEKSADPEEIKKEYKNFISEKISHLEDLRRDIVRKELEYERKNKSC
jgi:hypothetical protein